ncbi:transporter substrate-binding domain-containing protein [Pseudomonas sp. ZM23]|uniref:Transporter substrate-binding domain-containing protein n=1 Tax=Pseudomonas triclosanedens TaxID=2961893 RepID=A0ABY7A2B9_9PSED|nr:transporter substrate-binding domain-containing protein [Pseudomonas triclosanedens]MCP8464482.1 transporter substrate-binding domain-containing protein [Pseudomonas triclosanedens]MCP8471616.1 transporter substrate-binding domain-containing protein [Pseudomonas triclosanedens]MCP8477572.1 transporter substrate-binding domain-containing protein [Pseudomonas triclosanedens]WAI51035.1 transporter substrate-binding domain-containing protein [Pseudomonas triclosanedens]
MLRFASPALLLCIALATSAEPLRLAVDDWCPYICPDDPDRPGYLLEALTLALEQSPTFEPLPWPRALQMAREGLVDGVVGAYPEEADGLLIGHEPIGWVTMRFYTRADSQWRYTGPDSLDGQSVGLAQGYSYGPQVDAWRAEHLEDHEQVQILSGERVLERNIQKLLLGRISVLLEDRQIVEHYLHRNRLSDRIRTAGQLADKRPMYVALNPQLESVRERLDELDDGLRELRRDDRWRPLMQGYGVVLE